MARSTIEQKKGMKTKNNEKSLFTASGLVRHFKRTNWRPKNSRDVTAVVVVFSFFLFLGALAFVGWFDAAVFIGSSFRSSGLKTAEFPLRCNKGNTSQSTCPKDYYPTKHNPQRPNLGTCPSYFQWIHEDLQYWKESGITREMLEGARRFAYFRLVIVDGKAYMEKYRKSLQTRDVFTIWGILQLLRWYPGKLPDLEILFDTGDRPVIQKKHFRGPNARPPPLFRYCSDEASLDIVFPDWSFWGWAETNIRPWKNVLKDIKEGIKITKWKDRVPLAYWRGNPNVCPTRGDLLKCNVSDKDDWNTRLYIQNWDKESKQGYKQSNLEDQCTHRYKIYIEGWAWSVSEKYILACDAMTLYVTPRYYDFYIRGMVPLQHYWPIRDNSKCTSLKFAVEWGNNHTHEAEAIGEAGSKFIYEDVSMEFVYDYMFHLLNEYAKLLKFKPTVPRGALELCSETMTCSMNNGTQKKFMVESMVMSPSETPPCTLPPPSDPAVLQNFVGDKIKSVKMVEAWENEYWQNQKKNQITNVRRSLI